MYHADRTIEHILQIFDQQGHVRLTPAYVAYELDMTSAEAEKLLDEMVKHSLLDLDFDENGQLYYSLTQDAVIGSIGHDPRPARAPAAPATSTTRADGFDGHVGDRASAGAPAPQAGTSRARQPRTPGPEGCDGSVGPTNDWWTEPSPSQPAHRSRQSQPNQAGGGRQADSAPHSNAHTQLMRPRDQRLVVERTAEPMIAALLSVLLPGSGQLYNREVGKGLAMFISWWALWLVALGWIVNIWSVVDAYGTATRRRRLADELSSES